MNTIDFEAYRKVVLSEHSQQFYVPRLFRTAEEWDRWSTSDFRSVSLEVGSEPTLDDLLNQKHVVILGEPGSGKTTVAHAAVLAAFDKGVLPIFVSLRSYDGDFAALLAQSAPAHVLSDDEYDGKPTERVYILDGFDEAPGSLLVQLVADIEQLLTDKPAARLVLTSRQAFFRESEHLFHRHLPAFYILGLRSKDVDAFLRHEGTTEESFRQAVNTAGLHDELANPFALGTLSSTYRRTGSLGQLRSDAVRNVIDNLLLTRPTHDRLRERRALRMLAVAMETAARNELTKDQAALALTASLPIDLVAADCLLHDLCESLLISTPAGYAFGARSHGEYLAAEELSERSLDQIRLLAFTVSQVPIESWRNSLSYLVELHAGLRVQMARHHPSWVIRSSPHAFGAAQRTTITSNILARLQSQHEFLYRHPLVALDRLALFVEPGNRTSLLAVLTAPSDDVVLGNAILLLGKVADQSIASLCLEIGSDRTRTGLLRSSALAALSMTGTSAAIPSLLNAATHDDPLMLSLVDTAAALMDPSTVTTMLPVLVNTDAMVSSAFYRFPELVQSDVLESILDYLLANPSHLQGHRLWSYIKSLWEHLPEILTPALHAKVIQLLLTLENDYSVFGSEIDELTAGLESLPDQGDSIALKILEEFARRATIPLHLSRVLIRLIGPLTADWLLLEPTAQRLKDYLGQATRPEICAKLFPQGLPAPRLPVDRPALVESTQQTGLIEQDENFTNVLSACSRVPKDKWPQLPCERLDWVTREASQLLGQLDLPARIVWTGENQFSLPRVLPILLQIVDHYQLTLPDDSVLVHSLLGVESTAIVNYHKRVGLSAASLTLLGQTIGSTSTPNGALHSFLSFVSGTNLSTPDIETGLVALIENSGRSHDSRSWALRLLSSSTAEAPSVLLALKERLTGNAALLDELDLLLMTHQHRATIERRLSALLANDAQLRAAEPGEFDHSPLTWLGSITIREVWPKLVVLRERCLRMVLPNMAGFVSGIMGKIDLRGLIDVMRQQLSLAPLEWQAYERRRAVELEQEASITEAQSTPFEQVIRRLRQSTSLGIFKIWVEGPTDVPTVTALVKKLPPEVSDVVEAQQFGGWNQIRNVHWTPQGLMNGCFDCMVLLDGDRGRNWLAAPDTDNVYPESSAARDARNKLGSIACRVLERYGVENYFPQNAFERVMGANLSGHFPLAVNREVLGFLPGYNKNLNPSIAEATDISDLSATDLHDVLSEVTRLATQTAL